MWTPGDSLGIIYNGEIYNQQELRAELEQLGYVFRTDHSDTEVLLQGYHAWKEALPQKLNGMWAFAIYDRKEHTIFFSRDRFGKKPLFYALKDSTFAFASELTSLIRHSAVEHAISPQSLKKYFAYGFIPAPHTIYKNIHKLPGGHNLILNIKNLTFRVWKYWDFILEPYEKIPLSPEDEWGEQIRTLLEKSVKRRLMSDVPLGVFLSGGIDSSSITAYAAKILGGRNLKTFTIGFEEKSFDESTYARDIARLFQTDHYSETLSINNAITLLPEMIDRFDEPIGDSSIIPTYLLSRITRKKVTVALGGDGGDELFAGYDPFSAL
ncbi:MAG: asparagine synthase (glutamine-hydrolyzing), partial [Syntrophales bacterium LBB04]|nr:asparagine synthase (glutamine-hydrolyzing) [Syntrophales bacterium LBB04]